MSSRRVPDRSLSRRQFDPCQAGSLGCTGRRRHPARRRQRSHRLVYASVATLPMPSAWPAGVPMPFPCRSCAAGPGEIAVSNRRQPGAGESPELHEHARVSRSPAVSTPSRGVHHDDGRSRRSFGAPMLLVSRVRGIDATSHVLAVVFALLLVFDAGCGRAGGSHNTAVGTPRPRHALPVPHAHAGHHLRRRDRRPGCVSWLNPLGSARHGCPARPDLRRVWRRRRARPRRSRSLHTPELGGCNGIANLWAEPLCRLRCPRQ